MPVEEPTSLKHRSFSAAENPTDFNQTGQTHSNSQVNTSPAESEWLLGWRMSRTMVNFWLDALLMLAFAALSIVSTIVQFVFPPGVTAKGWTLWGLSFGQWSSLQFGLLSVLGFGILIHVMLHWTWVCGVITRKILRLRELPDDGVRTVYGVGLLILLLISGATIIGFAMLTIRMPPQ
jgi:hypothetical protein